MKLLLIAIFTFTTQLAIADTCIIISGAKKDQAPAPGQPPAFKNRELLKTGTLVAGKRPCVVVNGLAELKAYLKSHPPKAGQLPKPKLLLAIGAHGGKDDNGVVRFDFNVGAPSAKEMSDYIQGLTKSYHVGAVFHACQSGEVMSNILQNQTEGFDQLCLVTSSSKGRMSFSKSGEDLLSQLHKIDKLKNLEAVFNSSYSGMISSANWEEVGVSKYLRAKTQEEKLKMGLDVISNMDKVTRPTKECKTAGQINSALCAAPGISDAVYSDLLRVVDPIIPVASTKNFLSELRMIQGIHSSAIAKKGLDPKKDKNVKCYDKLIKAYTDEFGADLSGLFKWTDLERFKKKISTNTTYTGCPVEDDFVAGSLTTGYNKFAESRSKLSKIYSKTPDWGTDKFNLSAFASAANRECYAPKNKAQMIQSLLGESFYEAETEVFDGAAEVGGFKDLVTKDNVFRVSMANFSDEYQRKAIEKVKLENQRDELRRKACRSFTFDGFLKAPLKP